MIRVGKKRHRPATLFSLNRIPVNQPAINKGFLLYDQNRLYVGFECFKSDMNVLAANSVQRDSFFFADDHVEVLLDTYLDQRNCYASR